MGRRPQTGAPHALWLGLCWVPPQLRSRRDGCAGPWSLRGCGRGGFVQTRLELAESRRASGWIFVHQVEQLHERGFDACQKARVEALLAFHTAVVRVD